MNLSKEKFEQIVGEGIDAIPKRFLEKLDNVAIVIADEPTRQQLGKLNIRRGWTLFGLYEGVPRIARGNHYSAVLPDKITIFKRPIEQAARSKMEIRKIVSDTVWHEIAHHFGMNEHEVRCSELRRKKKM